MSNKIRVAVIGAGVVGLSAAVRMLETRGGELEVTVITEKTHPNVTSNGAGGFVYPDTAERDGRILVTMGYLRGLLSAGLAGEAGLAVVPTFLYFTSPEELPWWAGEVADFERLTREEAILRGLQSEPYETVFSFKSYVLEPKKYLPWLMSRFRDLGGILEQRRVESLGELAGSYRVAVNCSGLGARDLMSDLDLHPVRGQIVAVKAPPALRERPEIHAWHPAAGETMIYIIPHSDVTLLGGTKNYGNWSEVPDPRQSEEIYGACLKLLPALEGSEVVRTWACLRPARSTIRLGVDRASCPLLPVVHCYGHGGRGYVVHWGCALEVQVLVEECLKEEGLLG